MSSDSAILNAARRYVQRGFSVIPLPKGTKIPRIKEWQTLRLTEAKLPERFSDSNGNVGVLNGEPSHGLTDVDLDAIEAVAVADVFLPPTGVIFGRDGKPRSHWEYVGSPLAATKKFTDCDGEDGRDGTSLVELRSSGSQTVWPPSTHPSGEAIRFDEEGDPAVVDGSELQRAVALVAACALLARHWPKKNGSRHDIANAVAGYLLRGGIEQATVAKIVETAARVARDEEWRERAKDVHATAKTLEAGKRVTGGPTLAELVGEDVVGKLGDWLGLGPSDAVSNTASTGNTANASNGATGAAFISAADLIAEPDEPAQWLVDGLLPAGGLSIAGAKPKVGKSTLARNLATAVATGQPFLGRATVQGSVLYCAFEEKRADVKRHLRDLQAGAAPGLFVYVGPAPQDPVAWLRAAIQQYGAVLVVVDTLGRFVRTRDIKDYSEMTRHTEPLIRLAHEAGVHIHCLHHAKKGGSGEDSIDALLGSQQLGGFVDTVLFLKRHGDRTRTLETFQRTGTDLAETVVSLDTTTGRVTLGGALEEERIAAIMPVIMVAIGGDVRTESQIRDGVGKDGGLVGKALRKALADGRLVREGGGGKGDPYRYYLPSEDQRERPQSGKQPNEQNENPSPTPPVDSRCSFTRFEDSWKDDPVVVSILADLKNRRPPTRATNGSATDPDTSSTEAA